LRLLLVIFGVLDQRSGGYSYDRKLVDHLRANGHIVQILSIPKRWYVSDLLINFSRKIFTTLSSFVGDLILFDELVHPACFILARRLQVQKKPVAVLVHHVRIRERHLLLLKVVLYAPVEKAFLRAFKSGIFVSRQSRQDAQKLSGHGLSGPVCYPGRPVLAAGFPHRTSPSPSAGLRILFAAGSSPRKNLLVLLQALSRWRDGNWILTIAGTFHRSSYLKRCMTFVRSFGSKVRFAGHISAEALQEAYYSHHVLALASDYEGFGMVYVEAMVAGCVPLGSNVGGAPEVIGNAGLLVPPRNPKELCRALQSLLLPGRFEQLSQQARERSLGFPAWRQTLASLTISLEQIIANHNLSTGALP